MWGMREREESRITARFLVWVRGGSVLLKGDKRQMNRFRKKDELTFRHVLEMPAGYPDTDF